MWIQQDEVWQILDVGSIWMKEFASALSSLVPTISWAPDMTRTGMLRNYERPEQIANPPLTIERFPLQRGYARRPLTWLTPFESKVLARLSSRCKDPANSPLICTTPYYAPVAEKWRGPVVYYATDLTFAYDGLNPTQVSRLDQRMCKAAQAVCPNSRRIAEYFVEKAACDRNKIKVVPNATRESNIAPEPLLKPGAPPQDIRNLPRPIAGVIGNLSANMDWKLLAEAILLSPEITWVFVGPTSMLIQDRAQAEARSWVMKNANFVGSKSYYELQNYARAFDVAILPYKKKEPTYSGSSTRFYEHLSACRPMIATRGFAELLEKPPLVTLVDTAVEMRTALVELQRKNFSDGLESDRWKASKSGTWEERAKTILATIGQQSRMAK